MILAASLQQNLGVAIAVIAVLVWLVYVLYSTGSSRKEVGSEIELAPNRKPYLDDEQLETGRLDRSLALGLGCLFLLGVGLPLYWLAEPGRQDGAVTNFDAAFISRGADTYGPNPPNGFNCQSCHGPDGVGGAAPFSITDPITGDVSQVTWSAPALNTVLLRFSEEEVRQILVFGRANTPMPAWGVAGGGPMNDQQIDNLIDYLASIQLDPTEVQQQATDDARAAVARGEFATFGEALFALNCARCHTQGWSHGEPGVQGGGAFGPSLLDGATLRQFPAEEDHVTFITDGSAPNQPYGVRGVGSGKMPGFGQMLSAEAIQAIVDYERGL